jgi:hypothetical protein
MVKSWTALLAVLVLGACAQALPGGYSVKYADRGKAWLMRPDGTLAYGGLIKQLYQAEHRILLVALAEDVTSEDNLPTRAGNDCYAAFLIDPDKQTMRRIALAEATILARSMIVSESYDRPCPSPYAEGPPPA